MRRVVAVMLAVLAVAPGSAFAGSRPETGIGFRGWGPRLGLSLDPDQFHFGAHADFGNFAPRLRFQPNFELGLGDHITFAAFNFETSYRFVEQWDAWSPYAGGGLGLDWVDVSGVPGGSSDTDIGFSVLGGVERGLASGNSFFGEVKLGISDTPDLKLTCGWTFYR